jgi:hypothetical protein
MLAIAERYMNTYGDNAIRQLVHDLMEDDPATFKQGYTRENAVIATADAFGVSRDQVEEQLA